MDAQIFMDGKPFIAAGSLFCIHPRNNRNASKHNPVKPPEMPPHEKD